MSDLPKLVRDKIPTIMSHNGMSAEIGRTSDKNEIFELLVKKLEEECTELAKEARHPVFDESRFISEIADVLEVVHSLARAKGIAGYHLEKARVKKSNQYGGFDSGYILKSL